MEVKIRYDVSSKVIRKVDGIFPMSSRSMYACLLKLRMWAYSGSVIPAFRVGILEHSLTLFLLKIFSNSELVITGATFDKIILWTGLKFSVLLFYADLLGVVRFLFYQDMRKFDCLRFWRCTLLIWGRLVLRGRSGGLCRLLRG